MSGGIDHGRCVELHRACGGGILEHRSACKGTPGFGLQLLKFRHAYRYGYLLLHSLGVEDMFVMLFSRPVSLPPLQWVVWVRELDFDARERWTMSAKGE